jgi:hypothetical protein
MAVVFAGGAVVQETKKKDAATSIRSPAVCLKICGSSLDGEILPRNNISLSPEISKDTLLPTGSWVVHSLGTGIHHGRKVSFSIIDEP